MGEELSSQRGTHLPRQPPLQGIIENLDRRSSSAGVDTRVIGVYFASYRRRQPSGMIKMLFYTGARVSEFVQFRVEDLHLTLDPPQVYIAHAKGGSDGYVPILPALAQELRTHLNGRRTGYVFESNRSNQYTTRYVQRLVHDAAQRAGINRHVTPHRLRASVATILLDAGMPLDQVQKFLRHKRITTTQIYAETSLHGMSENYVRALGGGRKL